MSRWKKKYWQNAQEWSWSRVYSLIDVLEACPDRVAKSVTNRLTLLRLQTLQKLSTPIDSCKHFARLTQLGHKPDRFCGGAEAKSRESRECLRKKFWKVGLAIKFAGWLVWLTRCASIKNANRFMAESRKPLCALQGSRSEKTHLSHRNNNFFFICSNFIHRAYFICFFLWYPRLFCLLSCFVVERCRSRVFELGL